MCLCVHAFTLHKQREHLVGSELVKHPWHSYYFLKRLGFCTVVTHLMNGKKSNQGQTPQIRDSLDFSKHNNVKGFLYIEQTYAK